MFAGFLNGRRSRRSHRREGYRPLVEQLEDRSLLATLVFDTELVSLNLTGGPYPMPLASDPDNLLGDSIDGYGFVDTEVSITLSSQRPPDATPPGPGPPSPGQACATNEQTPTLVRGCFFGEVPPSDSPIDPSELDGQTFFVDSFFDVFFDITVTDVDPRPGRDFAGQPDGASFLLPDNTDPDPFRPTMQSVYIAIFDKDAANYGLVPPPEAAPYIGHFQIEIPLGGDINGNGENDKIKFTLASHAAGDENRTFIQLPDGTVLDEFDSAAFLEGAIVDESTDPPFTLGAGTALEPAFTGDGALTGPTVATSTLLNPVVNPGFSYVDANNNRLFEAGIDVALVNGELEDGSFDTAEPEGGYTVAIPGAGLVIEVALTGNKDLNYRAEGDLVINATLDSERDVKLSGDNVAVKADVTAARDVEVKANFFIDVSGSTVDAGRDVELKQHESTGFIDIAGASLTAGRDVELKAGGFIAGDNLSIIDAGRDAEVKAKDDIFLDGASITAGKDVEIKAHRGISAVIATITAGKDIELKAKLDIDADEATMTAGRNIELKSKEGHVSVQKSVLNAGKKIEIKALDEIFANEANMTAGKEIEMKALLIDITDAILTARKIKIEEG